MTYFASCCLLSYNRPQFLATAVESLIANANAPLELIIHDDGSSDPEVHRLLDGFLESGKASTVIRNPPGHNQGQGIALNRMFTMAKGDPIIKLDQDLIFQPDWLAKVNSVLYDNAAKNRSTGMDGIKRQDWQPLIGLLGLFHYHHDPVASMKCKINQFPGWQSHTHICGSGFAVRRATWRKLGPFEEHSDAFSEDWDFQRRVTASKDFVCALPDNDLVTNQGFGVGPSTVVVAAPPGAAPTVQKIHHKPYVINEETPA